jgi:hypothetical protein
VLKAVSRTQHKFYNNAPKKNQPKIEKVLEMYKERQT